MNDFAKLLVMGRLTREPLKFGSGNNRCAVFTVAVNRGKDENKKTTYVPAIAWGATSDLVVGLATGTQVNLSGDLEFHKSPKQERGELRLRVEAVVDVGDSKPVAVSDSGPTDAAATELF